MTSTRFKFVPALLNEYDGELLLWSDLYEWEEEDEEVPKSEEIFEKIKAKFRGYLSDIVITHIDEFVVGYSEGQGTILAEDELKQRIYIAIIEEYELYD